jgi:hypothetical protein
MAAAVRSSPAAPTQRDRATVTADEEPAAGARDDVGSGQAQALGEAIEKSFTGLSEFAKALKDLEASTRIFLIAVAFLLIAFISAATAAVTP